LYATPPAPQPPEGRLIEVGTFVGVPSNAEVEAPFVDVGDCGSMQFMAQSTQVGGPSITANTSPDGVVRVVTSGTSMSREIDGLCTASGWIYQPSRFVQLLIWNGGPGPADITAWIWCAP
jgi:hypothetical protein